MKYYYFQYLNSEISSQIKIRRPKRAEGRDAEPEGRAGRGPSRGCGQPQPRPGRPAAAGPDLLLHAFRVPQQQPARNLIRALAADVRCREVHLGGEARSCGRTDERGPVGAAGERQDSATHVGLGQRSAVEGGEPRCEAGSCYRRWGTGLREGPGPAEHGEGEACSSPGHVLVDVDFAEVLLGFRVVKAHCPHTAAQ